MRLHSILFSAVLAVSVPAFGVGCSSSDSSGGNGGAAAPQTISKQISAATGGTVDGPGVKLAIPPGALKADTTVTVTISDKAGAPGADKIAAGSVFDFGPDGTTFNAPVALTLDFTASGGPAGATPKIAFLKDGAWQTLDDSAATGGQITATTTHFTPFTVIWSGGQQQAGGCSSLDFTPCGGDLTGTWTFSAGCVDLSPTQADPTGGQCPSASAAATVDMNGTITFSGGNMYDVNFTQNASVTFTIPKTCLPGGATCSTIDPAATDAGESCQLSDTQDPKTTAEQGTYRTDPTTFWTTTAGDTEEGGATLYCVQGNTLKAKSVSDDGTTIIYVATKQ